MIYYGIILMMVVTSPLCKTGVRLSKKHKGKKIYVALWGALLFVLLAFRSTKVGLDTSMYRFIFENINESNYLKQLFLTDKFSLLFNEFGFYYLTYICSKFLPFQIYLAIISFISLAPVVFVIYRYSKNVCLSFVLYIGFSYYTFSMSGIRQACAIGILMLAYHYIKEKKLSRYLLMCLLAISFHSSALIFMPAYWVNKIPLKRKTGIIAFAFIMFSYVFRDRLWSIASKFARQDYSAMDGTGGVKMYLFMLLTIALGVIFRKGFIDIDKNESQKELFYFQVIPAMIWPIASINPALSRMYYYYHIFLILFVPELLISIKEKKIRLIVGTGYVLVGFYYLYSQVLNAGLNVTPYYFFWQ